LWYLTFTNAADDPTHYHSLARALWYLTFTRPDISYVVQQACLYMHDPPKPHFTWVKHILCYLRNTLDYGLSLFQTPPTELVVYSNADWVGYPDTHKSTLGYATFLDENFTSWSSKHQPTVCRAQASR
jgi:hypothetical protein